MKIAQIYYPSILLTFTTALCLTLSLFLILTGNLCCRYSLFSNILLKISKEIIWRVTFWNVSCCICSKFLCRKRVGFVEGKQSGSHFQMTCLFALNVDFYNNLDLNWWQQTSNKVYRDRSNFQLYGKVHKFMGWQGKLSPLTLL